MIKKNNNKKFGLSKERECKKILYQEGAIEVSRSRGSFGCFDCQAYFKDYCLLVSVKSTKQKYSPFNKEIEKLKTIEVPAYCRKEMRLWWSPNKNRKQKGWQIIEVN